MDRLTDSAVQTRDSLHIPVDLVIKIFSKLPAKSVARYRCLSKFWYDLIRSQYFIDLFAVNSSSQPQILFAKKDRSGISFFSAHQPSSENSFDTISPTHLSHYPKSTNCCFYAVLPCCDYGVPVNGLVCLTDQLCGKCMSSFIYNPSSGEILTLPIVKSTYPHHTKNLLGYDPIEKQFKVLSFNYGEIEKADGRYEIIMEIQVLTIETEELSWRKIEFFKSHSPLPFLPGEICINGVLYYPAMSASYLDVIVCFHVRSETFRIINVMEAFSKEQLPWTTILIDYDGKLGLLMPEESTSTSLLTGESTSFELWVLSDAEKHEWSEHVYLLPPDWKDVVGKMKLKFVGMMGTTEIVLSTYSTCPYIFFSYNIKKKIVRRLNIQGKEASTLEHIFLNYVEDVSLYKLIK